MASPSTGGSYTPLSNYLRTGATDTGGTYASATLTSATLSGTTAISGTTTIGSGATITAPTITAPVISGAMTVASGAVLTTPTATWTTTGALVATGSTGSDAANVTGAFPQAVYITGATGSGVNLPTGPAGAYCYIVNDFAGSMRLYSVGGTINGTTGTTAFILTTTGNKNVFAVCTSATGAWRFSGNT